MEVYSTRYQALLKEFETQSLIEGYESAIGDVYETAIPPLYPSSPKPRTIISFSLILDFFRMLVCTI